MKRWCCLRAGSLPLPLRAPLQIFSSSPHPAAPHALVAPPPLRTLCSGGLPLGTLCRDAPCCACCGLLRRYPLVMMAPEATTKARRCLLRFRRGAFATGAPVAPVIITYSFKHYNPGGRSVFCMGVVSCYPRGAAGGTSFVSHQGGLCGVL